MCGISGLFGKETSYKSLNDCIEHSKDILKNRGPDSFNFKKVKETGVICQSLLSISSEIGIDSQPFISKESISSFNGEIYNYLSLKEELISSKDLNQNNFKSHISEISIIDRLYSSHGINGIKRLNGMFAIAIYSNGTKEIKEPHLMLARDRLGVKPLFYGINHEGQIIYSSSCLLFNRIFPNQFNNLSIESVCSLLALGHLQSDSTLIKNVFQVPAGKALIYRIKSKTLSVLEYWSSIEQGNSRFEQPISTEESLNLLFDSINIRSNASGGVGCLLSGGVDSSLVASIYRKIIGKKINTYSLAFKDKFFDETDDAINVSENIHSNHHSIIYPGLDPELLDNSLLAMHGFPIGDTSAICSYFLFKELKKYERTFLGGDGGDEIFGGYFHHNYKNKYQFLKNFPINKIIKILKKLGVYNLNYPFNFDKLSAFENGIENINYTKQRIFWPKEIESIIFSSFLKKDFSSRDPMNKIINSKCNIKNNYSRMRILDINNKLVNMFLPKTDMMSMANSIEIREPLLDFRLVSLLLSKGEKAQIYLNNNSRPLQKKLLKEMVPNYNFNKRKQGFSSPVANDLRENKDSLLFLREEILKNQSLFEEQEVNDLINMHIKGKDNSSKIFTLAALSKSIKVLGLIL